jgi:forkhead box protein K
MAGRECLASSLEISSLMASRTASPPVSQRVSAVIDDTSFNAEPVPDKISAYYSLVFPNFTYYLQTLNVTIGRRCIPTSTASSSEQTQVDVDLGPLKSVSRLHARIEYEEEEERFVLVVLGRNGAWVDGTWCGKGSKVPLSGR